MNVYACPSELPPPQPGYANFDPRAYEAALNAHQQQVKSYLIKKGYAGKLTGEIVRFQVADGYAAYMVGDARRLILIHLPYGDAYTYEYAHRLTKSDLVARIKSEKAFAAKPRAA